MKQGTALVVTSLLSILLTTLHLTDDIVRGIAPAGLTNLTAVVFWVVWLYATVVLAERRAGYVIILLASVVGAGVPVLHMTGSGIAPSRGGFFFAWTLLALAVTATFSVILSARGLWSLRRPQPR